MPDARAERLFIAWNPSGRPWILDPGRDLVTEPGVVEYVPLSRAEKAEAAVADARKTWEADLLRRFPSRWGDLGQQGEIRRALGQFLSSTKGEN
jgi:hypothetical protein